MPEIDARIFRSALWVSCLSGLFLCVLSAIALLTYRTTGITWYTIALICMIPILVAGLLDTLTQKVELHHQHLVVVRNLRRKEYPRAEVEKVAWAKGSPVSLQLKSGAWIKLPGVGSGAQGFTNTLRAWIKG